jgi:hypothetical protein
MYKKPGLYILIFVLIICCLFTIRYFISAQDMNRTDPIIVANYIIKLVMVGDVDGLRATMHTDKKETFTPFSSEKREELQQIALSDKEKLGKETEVSEIRLYTSIAGKPAVAAKIRKKSKDVFVIILVRDGNSYYYDSFHIIDAKDYKQLTIIQKAK